MVAWISAIARSISSSVRSRCAPLRSVSVSVRSISVWNSPNPRVSVIVVVGSSASVSGPHRTTLTERLSPSGPRPRDLFRGIDGPQAVGAQDDQVAVAQRRTAGEVDDGIDHAAQATEDLVTVGVIDNLVRADDS